MPLNRHKFQHRFRTIGGIRSTIDYRTATIPFPAANQPNRKNAFQKIDPYRVTTGSPAWFGPQWYKRPRPVTKRLRVHSVQHLISLTSCPPNRISGSFRLRIKIIMSSETSAINFPISLIVFSHLGSRTHGIPPSENGKLFPYASSGSALGLRRIFVVV